MLTDVIKYDGSIEKFNAEKLNRWAQYATKAGGDWSAIAIATYKRLPNIAKSSDIHQTMINVCLDKEDLTYSRIAARLEYATIRKNMERILGVTDRNSFKEIFNALIAAGLWDSRVLPEYNPVWEDWYKDIYESRLEYWQIVQWTDKYSLQVKDCAVETPHIGCLGLALALHGDTTDAYELAKELVDGCGNLPTPALNGCRNGDFDTISCCVITGGDTAPSIGVAEHIAYMMTAKKAGIGIEFDTRSKGAPVKNGRVKHLGKHSIYASLDKAVKMFTQITRGGSATVTFKCIDPEVESIVMWKTQRVDIETRLDKIDYSFAYNDAFLQAVVEDSEWYLFDLVEAPEVHDAFYVADAATYHAVVKTAIAGGKKHTTIKARDLLKKVLIARNETGRMYSINVTRVNQHTPFIDIIRLSNLCVAPETQILTKRGYVPIAELEGEKAEVWNGKEWSEVDVVKTGVDQRLIKVTTNSGYEIECTPYHKFYVSTTYHSPYKEVRACDLKPGDKLAKFDLPVVEGDKELENAYINGFYSGDGCLTDHGHRIYLYGEKRKLAEFFNAGGKWTIQDDLNRQYNHFQTLEDKYFVPSNGFTVKSRLDWLAGYLDADGCVYRNGGNEQLVASSVEKNFLREVQMMLQTLGVSAKITKTGDEGFRMMPANDGTGELKEFWCRESYRLLITSCDTYKLQTMGLKLNRLKLTTQKPQRDAKQFIKVVSVVDEGRVDDTYCFTEPKRRMGMFNGLLTGQCQEIALATKPYIDMFDLYSDSSVGETAFCALGAVNVSKTRDAAHHRHVARVMLKAVDRMIEFAPAMTPSMKKNMMARRSVGIGITGLAGALYKNGMDYDGSDASLNFVSELSERHYYYLLEASQDMSSESGIAVSGIDTNWLPVDTMFGKEYTPKCDWEKLRARPRKHSVLVAHMPTESSAVFCDADNGIYPPRQKVINKKSRKGIVQYISKHLDGSKKLAWDVDNITLSKYYSRVQDFTDQAISADYYFDPSKYPDEKKPLSELMREWVAQAKLGNKTQYYINTRDFNGGSVQDVFEKKTSEESCTSCTL